MILPRGEATDAARPGGDRPAAAGAEAAPEGAAGRVRYRATGPVTLVGAGPVAPGALAAALARAPEAIAADGGGDVPLPEGASLRAVIGDMDSLLGGAALEARGVALHHIAEQETTDLEKCLYSVAAPLYLGVGFVGGRIDHHLAAMSALVRYGHRAIVLLGRHDLCFVCPPRLELDLPARTRVSFYPLGEATGTLSEGLRWPVSGLRLAPGGRIATSNEAVGGRLRVGFDAPCVLAILPLEWLDAVTAQLQAWAARE